MTAQQIENDIFEVVERCIEAGCQPLGVMLSVNDYRALAASRQLEARSIVKQRRDTIRVRAKRAERLVAELDRDSADDALRSAMSLERALTPKRALMSAALAGSKVAIKRLTDAEQRHRAGKISQEAHLRHVGDVEAETARRIDDTGDQAIE